MHDVKADNRTETASDIADQRWNDMSLESAEDIVAYLGNNGRMYIDLPGTLKVTKDIDVADGFDAAKNIKIRNLSSAWIFPELTKNTTLRYLTAAAISREEISS